MKKFNKYNKLEKKYPVTRYIYLRYEDDGVDKNMCINCRNTISVRSYSTYFKFCPFCGRPIVGWMWNYKNEPEYDSAEYHTMMKIIKLKRSRIIDINDRYRYDVWVYDESFFSDETKLSNEEKIKKLENGTPDWHNYDYLNVYTGNIRSSKKEYKRSSFNFNISRDIPYRIYNMKECLSRYNWIIQNLPNSTKSEPFVETWYKVCIVRLDTMIRDINDQNRNAKIIKEKIFTFKCNR